MAYDRAARRFESFGLGQQALERERSRAEGDVLLFHRLNLIIKVWL